jgi:hypothetical protein
MYAYCILNCEVNDNDFMNMLSAIRNIEVSTCQRELLLEMTLKNSGLSRIVRNVEVSAWQRCLQQEVIMYYDLSPFPQNCPH